MTVPGLLLAATGSGSGKTLVSAGLLRAWTRMGRRVQPFKSGPDYIDPGFLGAAAGRPCPNLDPWAMTPGRIAAIIGEYGRDADGLLIEGVMGLFDGAADGSASNADLAAALDLPVLLLVDGKGRGGSLAALVHGFTTLRDDLDFAGLLVNQAAGARHETILRQAAKRSPETLFGILPRRADLRLPSRHLGLIQAGEQADLEALLEAAADWVADHLDLEALWRAMAVPRLEVAEKAPAKARGALPPLGQHIAIARDPAFTFLYPHLLDGWRAAGAELCFFSPLNDESPEAGCDAVYLPGGYPELFAGRLADARSFLDGLRGAAEKGVALFGECGGYMVLGEGLIDAEGRSHAMAGLLPLVTSFEKARLHLGYRRAALAADHPFGNAGQVLAGHEFHYANIVRQGPGDPLFACHDACGDPAGDGGLRVGSVSGSFVHVIAARG